MLDWIFAPAARALASTVDVTSRSLSTALDRTVEGVLWSGPLKSGDVTVERMTFVAQFATFTAVILLWTAWVLVRRVRANRRHPDYAGNVFTGEIACALFLVALFTVLSGLSYGIVAEQARTAVYVTAERVVLLVDGERTDIPASALTSIARRDGSRSVTLKFAGHRDIVIDARDGQLGGLSDAVDRMATNAGSKAPIGRKNLG